jgi:hypothetical protein
VRRGRAALVAAASLLAGAALLSAGSARATDPVCSSALGGATVGGPGATVSWRAGIEARTAVFDRLSGERRRPSSWLTRAAAPSLLVLETPRVFGGRCWLRVRLPWRPNDAAGWVGADAVLVAQTPWQIDISTARRTLTVERAGKPVRTMRVVVGKPTTPTPAGLFAVTWAIRWNPDDFLGSWVLQLTAHSDVLAQFDGGDGTVGIHGRGGASLADPLGSALSHGCIRLANGSIDWLVQTIGVRALPGTPVRIS